MNHSNTNKSNFSSTIIRILFLGIIGMGLTLVRPALAGKGGQVVGSVSTRPQKYLKHVIVYIKKAPGSFKLDQAVLDQRGLVFLPHVLPIVKGSTVKFLNSDKVGHNVFSPDNEKYNLGTWPQGQTRSYVFKKEGVYQQLCHVH